MALEDGSLYEWALILTAPPIDQVIAVPSPDGAAPYRTWIRVGEQLLEV